MATKKGKENNEEKTLIISELIKTLNTFKEDLGDVEVFVVNAAEERFDGVGTMFALMDASNGEKTLALTTNNVSLKI